MNLKHRLNTYPLVSGGSRKVPEKFREVVPTGFDDLDEVLDGGLRRGTLNLIAGSGKSYFAKMIAENVARAGMISGYSSYDLSRVNHQQNLFCYPRGIVCSATKTLDFKFVEDHDLYVDDLFFDSCGIAVSSHDASSRIKFQSKILSLKRRENPYQLTL